MDPQVASQCTDSNSLGRVVMKYLVFKIRNPSGVSTFSLQYLSFLIGLLPKSWHFIISV